MPEQAPANYNSPWYGASSLGLTFGGQNIARKPDTSLRYTVIPLQVMPSQDVTMPARADAISASYTGRLQSAVDLYRQTVEQNGFMRGVLWTMAHGLLGMPLSWQGDGEMVSALADQDGTPGDFARMLPEAECAQIFSDAIGLGFGLGQLLLMCWRCDGVEWARSKAASDAHEEIQTCTTCCARLHERPIGARKLYQLRWRDARWLWRDPVSLEWWYIGRQGQVRVRPGDGEWVLIKTVPDLDIWTHGPWKLGTEAALFARDSRYDRQNTSRACAPTHVFKVNTGQGTDPKVRADVEAQADGLKYGNSMILSGEWDHRIDAATGDFTDVTSAIVEDVDGLWEVCITGNRMGTESGTGFSNMDVYARATRERRSFYGGVWIGQIRAQVLTWWTIENFGTRNAPVGRYDTRSPEDKKVAAEADGVDGDAVGKMVKGYGDANFELEPQYLVERAQQRGIRIRPKQAAAPSPGAPPASPPPAAAPPTPAGPPPAAARAADDEDEPEDDDEVARFAAEMTAHGRDRCEHQKSNRCRLCGIERVRGVDPSSPTGWRTAWRAIPKVRARAGGGDELEAAIRDLKSALAALDELGPEAARLDAWRAKQEREGDGKFGGSDGTGKKPATDKAPAKDDPKGAPKKAGSKADGLGKSKAAHAARGGSKSAVAASEAAKSGAEHASASKAHADAAEQHKAAAKASRKPEYREAHQRAAAAHEKVAGLHAEVAKSTEAVKKTAPTKGPPGLAKTSTKTPPAPPKKAEPKKVESAPAKSAFGPGHGLPIPGLHNEEPAVAQKYPKAAEAIRRALGNVPTHVQQAILIAGGSVHSVASLTDHPDFAPLKNEQPRGWPNGTTWSKLRGGCMDKTAVVAIGGSLGGGIAAREGSHAQLANVALHEMGHSADKSSDGAPFSHSPWFAKFHKEATTVRDGKSDALTEWSRLKEGNPFSNGAYFRLKGHAGREEFFAEVFSESYRSPESRARVDKHFPGLRDAMDREMNKAWRPNSGLTKKGG